MSEPEEDIQLDSTHITLDAYGVKAKIPRPVQGDPAPEDWQGVRERLKSHMLRLAVAPTALLATAFESATSLLRGIGGLPQAAASRLMKAHAKADSAERRKQSGMAIGSTSSRIEEDKANQSRVADIDALVGRLAAILESEREKGRDADVVLLDGSILIVLGTDQERRTAIEAHARREVALLKSGGNESNADG